MNKKIVIIGAGLAGLSCAYHLGRKYEIYEMEKEPGGLCRSKQVNGFGFDFTGHLLHFKSQYVFNLVKKLLDGNLKHHIRNSWVFSKDTHIPYPFQSNINSLPKDIIKECLVGLFRNRNRTSDSSNFYEWMIQNFGKGVVRHFMLPYNLKFWKIHPEKLSCGWVDKRIPLSSLEDSLSGVFESSMKSWGYNWHFWYPKTGGIAVLPRAFEKKVGKINYDYKVKRIDLKRKIIIFDNSFSTKFDYLVSTIPLVEMEKIVYPIPEKIKMAIRKLRYLSIFNLNLGVSRNNSGDKHWIYFPEDKIIFYRVGFFNNFSPNLAPSGHASLYVEVSYLKENFITKENRLIERINHDLVKYKIISSTKQIVSSCINNIKYGYVIYNHDYSESKGAILKFLKKNNIFSIGRFGSWRYFSMEESIIDGKNTAEMFN